MRRLRAECAWKREQTHRSLVRYLVEESAETVEAIETGTAADLQEELGDLLLQVYFHSVVAEQAGDFDLDDVAAGIVAKLRRRNPHVFGADDGRAVRSAVEVNELWESAKAAEKQRSSVTEGLASSLPALLHADKVLDRLGRAGVEVDVGGDGLGQRLLALVAEAHAAGIDPEQELRDAVRRVVAAHEG